LYLIPYRIHFLLKRLKRKMKLTSALAFAMPLCASAFAPSKSAVFTKTLTQTVHPSIAVQRLEPSALFNVPATAELPEKLYFPKDKEAPKILGGVKIGTRKLTVVTGASSGLGLNAAYTLATTGRHFVILAVRDVEKGKKGTFVICMSHSKFCQFVVYIISWTHSLRFTFDMSDTSFLKQLPKKWVSLMDLIQ
jgi:hypothetical protein